MTKELFEDIEDALDDRDEWSCRQETWYEMRLRGIRRSHKPYPNCPDQHYPLADTMIEKLKPLYIGQLYANEQLASFVSTQQQGGELTQGASEWFDYQIKQKTNFECEIYSAIDGMLQDGFSIIKVYWDADSAKLCFSKVDPLHVIVPCSTEHLQASDWFVHIVHLSEAQYRKNTKFSQGDELIKKIKGKGDDVGGEKRSDNAQKWIEGVNCGQDNEIVLWEVYHRLNETGKSGWMVDTISPVVGWDCQVRGTFGLPYTHGRLPFFRIQFEVTEKTWYAPRGICEIIAPHEQSLNRLWNGLFQHLDFHGTPTYKQTGTSSITNTSNYRSAPGGILPPGIEPADSPRAPVEFDQQMQFTRALAEDRVAVPDLSASEHLSGSRGANGGTTATQINAIVGQSGQSNDLRARVFRLDLAVGYKMAWCLLNQYKKDELDYLKGGSVQQVQPESIHEKYIIEPNGSPDSWNKQAQVSRRLAMYQLLFPNPFMNKGELTKWLLEVEDPKDIKRLYQDPGEQAAEQEEQQANECVLMLNGFVPKVAEADDDKTHLMTMAGFFQRRMQQNEPISSELARAGLMHGNDHSQAMTQKKDPALRQITQQMLPMIQILSQIANQPEQPSNVVQMPGTMQPQGGIAPSGPSLPGGGPASAPGQDQGEPAVDTAVKVGNMLTNMVKAGIPVTHAEINKVMQEAGLAPLSMNPTTVSELNGTDDQPMLTDGADSGGVLNTERSPNGMVMPPAPVQPQVNVINIATRKTITVKRNKDGSLTGEVTEVLPAPAQK